MKIEVDQSGKIEKTNEDTILAFSNQEQYVILIKRKIKQTLFRSRKDKRFKIKLFAICLYLLLKDRIGNKEIIMIDEEYPGHERYIKECLLNLIRRDFLQFDKGRIRFGRITRASNAHNIALLTYRGMLKPNRIIEEEEIFELI